MSGARPPAAVSCEAHVVPGGVTAPVRARAGVVPRSQRGCPSGRCAASASRPLAADRQRADDPLIEVRHQCRSVASERGDGVVLVEDR
jgi:hypothetical protein